MTYRHKGPLSKYTVTPLDEDLYFELFDILHDGIFRGNYNATARCLSVSRPTAMKMAHTAPRQHYWNGVLRQTIQELLQNMATSRHKRIRERVLEVKSRLNRSSKAFALAEYIQWNENNNSGAVLHLAKLIRRRPLGEISTRELRLPANSGGYSMRTLRQAADILMLRKETRGFGEDKETWYIWD